MSGLESVQQEGAIEEEEFENCLEEANITLILIF